MARKIQPTPVLTGKDAIAFRIRLMETLCRKLTPEEIKKKEEEKEMRQKNYDLMRKISDGKFY